ncbi:MAG: 1-deoxy-D-xylulose-5-phosphate reductoisomerase [Verrucomicrobiota bacterium]
MPDAPYRKKVVILGSTGSIGQSALKVARDVPERMEVIGLAAHSSAEKLGEQITEFGVKQAVIVNESCVDTVRSAVGSDVELASGDEALVELATLPDADMVLISIIGVAGLKPALAAIEAGKDLAVASKEILVMAGEAVMTAAREKGVKILPVDSEHNAIFQCLEGQNAKEVSRLILTASGGPFRTSPSEHLIDVKPEQALKHPTWEMGQKITIDSATLFNKGLEMIEARWLFDIEMDRVDVIVHPQSIIHSMVEFIDSSTIAQLSVTDMCFPIQYAITYPDRVPNRLPPLDFAQLAKLEFEEPRWEDFPALRLAQRAGREGGTLPAVLNAANEVAVDSFLSGKLNFPGIWELVASVMESHTVANQPKLEEIVTADLWARDEANAQISS